VVLSKDVIYIEEQQPKEKTLLEIYSDINLILGDKVHIDLMGIKGNLQGRVAISDAPDRVATGTGELSIEDGYYEAYGQQLKIRTGKLQFAGGPVNDPGLNIEAIKHIQYFGPLDEVATQTTEDRTQLLTHEQEITVGVNVGGTLHAPQLSLFSEPEALSQTDILSYLILGKPTNMASTSEGELLFHAANAIEFIGGEARVLIDQLGHTFGIDEVTIQSETHMLPDSNEVLQNTSLILGKALSSKLYVNYSIGLIEPINTFRVNYKLTKRLTVRTDSNAISSGADIVYIIERK